MDCSIRRNSTITNWRLASSSSRIDTARHSAIRIGQNRIGSKQERNQKRRNPVLASNFFWALVITVVIIFTQLFLVHHYFSNPARKRHLLSSIRTASNEEANLLAKSSWFCHSFPHLNHIAQIAHPLQIDLVIVDPDLLSLLIEGEGLDSSENQVEFSNGGKSNQEASQKSIIHLAAINETSGGQPNLKIFFNAIKEHYHIVQYQDASETMPAEVYKRQLHELDDVQVDAIKDSSGRLDMMNPFNQEISKIYTEFITHVFILNATNNEEAVRAKWDSHSDCPHSSGSDNIKPFIVLHLFVLYNYEFQPETEWIQSSLLLNVFVHHKLLTYGVHSIDFRVPLNQYYIHEKRKTSTLSEVSRLQSSLKLDRPMNKLKIFEPDYLLAYTDNTYLHCKQSPFNISALIIGNRRMSPYLETLNAAKPLRSSKYRSMLLEQLSIALQFMDVFSKSYGKFNFWLTGSSLLAYHKFCQLIAVTPQAKRIRGPPVASEDDLSFWLIDDYEEQVINENTIHELELGLFESELNTSMLSDLSQARMIGVTMITDWRDQNKSGLVSFQVKDCPNLMFSLHFYRRTSDFYGQYYVTNDNMIYSHKLKRRKSQRPSPDESLSDSTLFNVGHHVFAIRNLELCWTRLDHLKPFRVPCDVHDHLLKIYVR